MDMEIYEEIIKAADAMESDLIAIRRDFHKYAERGWLEIRTSSLIARKLKELGYEVLIGDEVCKRELRMGVPSDEEMECQYQRAIAQGADPEFAEKMRGGMTGVIGLLRLGEGPVVALRFDIDALGVRESCEETHRPMRESFASVNDGVMHACGHDGHAAIGLGVARILKQMEKSLCGTVKLIFQPAEEGVRGAKAIVEQGHLDDAQYFLASHVTANGEKKACVVTPGSHGALATCKYDVTFKGQAVHAGKWPEKGKNVLLAASTAILNLYAIPRHSEGISRINVGTIQAGSGRNVIPDEAKMEIEIRGQTTEINKYMCEYAENILKNAAAMHQVTCEIKLMGSAPSMESDNRMVARVRKVCEEKLKLCVSENDSMVSGGSEDAAYMVERIQKHGGEASYMRLMTDVVGLAHSRNFDFDEKILVTGVKIFCGVVYDILDNKRL